jgi:bifunctional non-homologous end joining protein LigD
VSAAFPKHPEAELAVLVAKPPAGEEWLHEIKRDGYRMFCLIHGEQVRFVSRNGQNWTDKFPTLAESAKRLKTDDAVIDGEVVVLDEHGASRFQLLQNALSEGRRAPLVYYAFDVVYCDRYELSDVPLDQRKERLKALIPPAIAKSIRYSDHVVGQGDEPLAEACRRDLEGIISKRRNAPYVAGRSGDWLKSKCKQQQEFVVAGYTDPGGSRAEFGSLLLGYYDRKKLAYAGRVGTGFTQQSLRELLPKFKKLQQKSSPYELNTEFARGKGMHWIRPKLVAQIEFANWTDDNLLRQPSFQGLRDDKPATAIRRERPKPLATAKKVKL